MHSRQLLHPAIEEHEVVHQFEQPLLGAHLEQVLVELEAAVVCFVLFPLEEILFLRLDRAVLQSLGIVPGEEELHRAEEPLVEFRALVREALANAVADGNTAVLQFDYTDGDAIEIEHEVRTPLVLASQRDLLGDREIVFPWLVPIHQVDRFRHLPRFGFHVHAVSQQAIHRLVVVIQAAVGIAGFGGQPVECPTDLRRAVAALGQIGRQQSDVDVAVVRPVGPIAEIAIAEFIAEQADDPLLRRAF